VAGNNEPRSIAAEAALLFLNELEPRIESDPELLVSSEAILSFAAIRRPTLRSGTIGAPSLQGTRSSKSSTTCSANRHALTLISNRKPIVDSTVHQIGHRTFPRPRGTRVGFRAHRSTLGELLPSLQTVSAFHVANLLPGNRRKSG
jgi:hypothetical protein